MEQELTGVRGENRGSVRDCGRVLGWDAESGEGRIATHGRVVSFRCPKTSDFEEGDLLEFQGEWASGVLFVWAFSVLHRPGDKWLALRQDPRNWLQLVGDEGLRKNLHLRSEILDSLRAFFRSEGFAEIDVPSLVALPGMEPHLQPIPAELKNPQGDAHLFYLHTSPEYALKKLLVAGFERIYALTHAYRNGELSATHNPEFTLLEWYRARVDYNALMSDCERLVLWISEQSGFGSSMQYQGTSIDLTPPWPRLTIREAVREYTGVDISGETTLEELVTLARQRGYEHASPEWPWEDVFYLIFLNEVEPRFPRDRPLFLTEYPRQMGALARAKPDDPFTVERFELYIGGLELANAFSELTGPVEQRHRLEREWEERTRLGREAYPVDESFLEALELGMPPSAGIALGVDRLVMLFANAADIREVLAFPAQDLLEEWKKSYSR